MSSDFTESPSRETHPYTDAHSEDDHNTQLLLAEETQEPRNLVDIGEFSPTSLDWSENNPLYAPDSFKQEVDIFPEEDSRIPTHDENVKRVHDLEEEVSILRDKYLDQEKKIYAIEKGMAEIATKIAFLLEPNQKTTLRAGSDNNDVNLKRIKSSPGLVKRTRGLIDKKDDNTPDRRKGHSDTRFIGELSTNKSKSTLGIKYSSASPVPKVVIFFHGKGSTDHPNLSLEVESLQGTINDDMKAFHSHLVSVNQECGRCLKALIALVQGIPIVKKDWISESFKMKEWIHPQRFMCSDVPRQSVSRRQILPEFMNAIVGVYGDTKPPMADLSIIIEALGGFPKEITMVTRRKTEDVHIIIISKDVSIESLRVETQKMPVLQFIITDENLKEVIWEGDHNRIQKIKPISGTVQDQESHTPSAKQIAMPYLQEIPDLLQQNSQPKRIYPISLSNFQDSNDGQFPPLLVGRSPSSCAYILPYEGVSRIHFALWLTQQENQLILHIEDRDSTNGIFINKQKRAGRTRLHEYDVVLIGGGAGVADGKMIDDTMETEHSAKFVVRLDHNFAE